MGKFDPVEWKEMTPERQEELRSKSELIARTAFSHSCSILLGCPRKPTVDTRNATGTLVLVDGRHYVITANHVLEGYAAKLKDEVHVHFQIGNVNIDPYGRLVHRDVDNDLAVLVIDEAEASGIAVPYRPVGPWPPAPPTVGQLMQICGFASCNRTNHPAGMIESTALLVMGLVDKAYPAFFVVKIEREKIVWDGDELLPPRGVDLGGLSGGPVISIHDGNLVLVGIVTQGSAEFDLIYVSNLASLPATLRNATG